MNLVNFYLRKGYRGKSCIQLSFYFPGGRFRKMLPWEVEARHWSDVKRRVLYGHPRADEINRTLEVISKRIMDVYLKSVMDGSVITVAALRAAITPGKALPPRHDFKAVFRAWIQDRKDEGRFSYYTLRNYLNCLAILVRYEKDSREALRFDQMDTDWLNGFRSWMERQELSSNTIAGHFRCLISFLRNVGDRIGVKTSFQGFRVGFGASRHIYLSVEELARLEACVLPPLLRTAADAFLFCCFTGLRYSDLKNLMPEHIRTVQGKEMIFIRQQKTGDEVVIALHPVARRIMDRIGGIPRAATLDRHNHRIREACRLAGITDKIVHYYNQGGKVKSKVVEKWELVSSHTARRSAATNMHIAGVDSRLIMRLTGHKSEQAFKRYLRIDNQESALIIAKTEFFAEKL